MHRLLFISAFLATVESAKSSDLPSIFNKKTFETSSFCKKYGCQLVVDSTTKFGWRSYSLTKMPIIELCVLPNFKKCRLNEGNFAKDIDFGLSMSYNQDNNQSITFSVSLFIYSFSINKGYWSLNQPKLIDFFSDFLQLVAVKSPQKLINNIIIKCDKSHYGKIDNPGVPFCDGYNYIDTFNQQGAIEFGKGSGESPGNFAFELKIMNYRTV